MNKILFLLITLTLNNSLAQQKADNVPFTNFVYGIYGGINFNNTSEIGGDFQIDIKTNINSNLYISLSAGYYKSIMQDSRTIKTYLKATIDTVVYFQAIQYDVNNITYDVFPVSLGLQYFIKNESLSPYLFSNFSYNFIDAKIIRSAEMIWSFNSFDELPDEFKTKNIEELPDNSFGISAGVGIIYKISKNLSFDFRYYYKYDDNIINTHHLIVGINF